MSISFTPFVHLISLLCSASFFLRLGLPLILFVPQVFPFNCSLVCCLLACLRARSNVRPRRCSNFFYEMKFDAVLLVHFFPTLTKIFHFRSPSMDQKGGERIRTHTYTRDQRGAILFFSFFFFENRGHATHKSRETVGFYDETYPFSPPHRGETRVKRTDTRPSTPPLEIRSSVVHSQIVIANLFNSPIPYRTSVGNKFIDSFVLTNETGRGWKMVGFDGNRTSLFATVRVCGYTRIRVYTQRWVNWS